jgi:hypothetical protein
VTAHDGFTLRDLVSYNDKHNEANGEDNRDGDNHNRSWNHGAEGDTDDPAINALRARQQRNFLATVLLSQGVPMLLAGDEIGRTQWGNNNAYCQDNEVSWIDWASADLDLLYFTVSLLAFRRAHPVFRRRRWFQGRPLHGKDVRDIAWFTPGGQEMSEEDWNVGFAKSLMVYLNGDAIPSRGPKGEAITTTRSSCASTPISNPCDSRCPPSSSAIAGIASSTRPIPTCAGRLRPLPAAPSSRSSIGRWSCSSCPSPLEMASRLLPHERSQLGSEPDGPKSGSVWLVSLNESASLRRRGAPCREVSPYGHLCHVFRRSAGTASSGIAPG